MSENDNSASRREALSILADVFQEEESSQPDVIADDPPTEKPKCSWLWIDLSLAIGVVAVLIAVPVTIRWQSGGTMPKPLCEPFTSECLAVLLQSHLPTIAFDNTTFPESRALIWMTEVDTRNQQTLSDDELVQRFAMAAIGYSIHGLDNWLTRESECSWGKWSSVLQSVR